MKSVVDSNEETVVMVFSGEYDLSARDKLRPAFDALTRVHSAILDFTAVAYIDSTVLSQLMRLGKVRAEARLDAVTLVAANPNIRRIVTIVHLDQLLRLVESLDDALSRDGKPATVKYVFLAGNDPGG